MRTIYKWVKIILGGISYSSHGHGPGWSLPREPQCPTAREIAEEIVALTKGDSK